MAGYMRRYNLNEDPYFSQGINNIARMFAPPSATDMLAGARVQQMRSDEEAKQKALGALAASGRQDLVDIILSGASPDTYKAAGMARMQGMAADGALDRNNADQWGVSSGMFTPSNTYGVNADQEATKLRQTGMQEAGANQRTQMTNDAAMERERLAEEGRNSRLTDDQVLGRVIMGLPLEEQQNIARVKTTKLENVIGPDGKPVVSTGVGAIGQQPVVKADQQTEVARLIAERDALPPDDPRRKAYDDRLAALGRGQQQGKYDQAQDEAFAKLNEDIFANAQTAHTTLGTLNRIGQILGSADPGKFANFSLEMRKALETFGVPTGDLSDSELLRSLGGQFALKLRDPSMGGGMPGALSDSDRQFLAAMAPGLENTVEGNRKLVDYYSRVSKRAIDVERLRQEYVQKNGRVDEGFRTAVSRWAEQNPLFPEAKQTPQPGATAPQGAPAQPSFQILQVR